MKNKNTNSIPKKFLIPIIVLSVTAAFLFITFISEYADNFRYSATRLDSFYYYVDNKDYGRAYQSAQRNIGQGENSEKFQEVYAIANYWYDSFYECAFKNYKDVSSYQQDKEKQAAKVTSMTYALEEIDEMLKPYK